MADIADELASIPFLRRCPSPALRASVPLWSVVALGPGEVLWTKGSEVDEMGITLLGQLVAEIDGVEVGKVMPAELLGEASAFFAGRVRSATLRARTNAQVITLPTSSLLTLRSQRSPVYDALLDQALLTLVRRVGATNRRIAEVADGALAAPARSEPSALVRLWKALRPGGPSGPCPPLEPLLRRQPGLADASAEAIAGITAQFSAQPVQEGEILFLEGEPGAAAYIVADGKVDVLRHVRGDRAERLAQMNPGDPFGINTLIEKGPRTASCVAVTPGWVWRLDAEAFAALRGEARLAFRESVLGALATQIRGANVSLQRALEARGAVRPASLGPASLGPTSSGPASLGPSSSPASRGPGAPPTRPSSRPGTPDTGFADLLRASGYLEALPMSEAGLEGMEVVITPEALRNRKNRVRG